MVSLALPKYTFGVMVVHNFQIRVLLSYLTPNYFQKQYSTQNELCY